MIISQKLPIKKDDVSVIKKQDQSVAVSALGSPTSGKTRIHALDEIRGFAVFCMIFYHAFYSMAYLFSIDWGETLLLFFMPLEPFFAGLFILISGISSDFSRANLKRGVKLFFIAMLVSGITIVLFEDQRILFGILHMLSISMIVFGLFQKQFEQIETKIGLIVCAALFVLTIPVNQGFFGIAPFGGISIPKTLYQLDFLYPFGIYNHKFYSSDYFPLFPWMFLFLFGTFLGRCFQRGCYPSWMNRSNLPVFSFLGRHALFCYLLHQPVIYGVLWIIELFF